MPKSERFLPRHSADVPLAEAEFPTARIRRQPIEQIHSLQRGRYRVRMTNAAPPKESFSSQGLFGQQTRSLR
jgi:hypothetical protein